MDGLLTYTQAAKLLNMKVGTKHVAVGYAAIGKPAAWPGDQPSGPVIWGLGATRQEAIDDARTLIAEEIDVGIDLFRPSRLRTVPITKCQYDAMRRAHDWPIDWDSERDMTEWRGDPGPLGFVIVTLHFAIDKPATGRSRAARPIHTKTLYTDWMNEPPGR
jgi:hypothetical protein